MRFVESENQQIVEGWIVEGSYYSRSNRPFDEERKEAALQLINACALPLTAGRVILHG